MKKKNYNCNNKIKLNVPNISLCLRYMTKYMSK